MTDSKLTELLERAADRTEVGPPPLDALYAGASRRRRRRTVAVSLTTAAAVVAVVGGTTVLMPSRHDKPAPVTSPPPVAMRLVGVGHAAIAVPVTWGTNQTRCSTPQKDTVILDDPVIKPLCGAPSRKGVDSVLLTYGRPSSFGFRADESFEIDGVPAQRERTSCQVGSDPQDIGCSGSVAIPSLRVWFHADSSSAAEVDRILARIEIVPDRTGVPSYRSLRDYRGSAYAEVLREVGLTPTFATTKSPNYRVPGYVVAVSPAPGTMLKPGATVTVTVAS